MQQQNQKPQNQNPLNQKHPKPDQTNHAMPFNKRRLVLFLEPVAIQFQVFEPQRCLLRRLRERTFAGVHEKLGIVDTCYR